MAMSTPSPVNIMASQIRRTSWKGSWWRGGEGRGEGRGGEGRERGGEGREGMRKGRIEGGSKGEARESGSKVA